MPPRNVAQLYGQNRVLTASPAELTLMLYEGAIKFCNIASEAIDEKNIEKAHNNIRKAENIIAELQATLDHKYPVAKDFDNVYDYIYRRLVEANISKDKDILADATEQIRGMRDTWKEVMKKAPHAR